jgi:hypothetical protein
MAIERAERDLQRLRQRIADLEAQVSELRVQEVKIIHFLEMYRRYGREEIHPESGSDAGQRAAETKLRTPKPPPNVQAAIDILREAGRPITTRVLVDLLASRGITIGGGNPITNLSGALSKWKDLLSASRVHGWSLKEWSSEPDNGQSSETNEGATGSRPEVATSVSEDSGKVGDQPSHDVAA